MTEPADDWVVLLVGGASGVGKSMASQRLARRLGVNLTEVDDFMIVLETTVSPDQLPLLHFWRTNLDEYLSWTAGRRVDLHVRVCREIVEPAMTAVIADHLATGTRVVFEGDFLLPGMATTAWYGAEPNDGRVRALFVSEPDEAQIAANLAAREGDVEPERPPTHWLFDAYLRQECVRHGVPVVDARPWDSVVDRSLAALAGAGAPRLALDGPPRGER